MSNILKTPPMRPSGCETHPETRGNSEEDYYSMVRAFPYLWQMMMLIAECAYEEGNL